jgi:hypothetical protein
VRSVADVAAIVRAVAPKPVNVLVGGDYFTVAQLATLACVAFRSAVRWRVPRGRRFSRRKEIAAAGRSRAFRAPFRPGVERLFGSIGRHDAC